MRSFPLTRSPRTRSIGLRALVMAAVVAAFALPQPAQAWWRGGWGGVYVGLPVVVPAPVYVYPPAYYPPPVAYSPRPSGQTCYAGAYICPLDQPGPQGAPCSCPANQNTRAGGRIG